MSTTTVQVHVAARDISPRGARPIGEFAARVLRSVGHSLVKVAERQGARRASQELRHIARSFEGSQPELAGELHAAAARCEDLLSGDR